MNWEKKGERKAMREKYEWARINRDPRKEGRVETRVDRGVDENQFCSQRVSRRAKCHWGDIRPITCLGEEVVEAQSDERKIKSKTEY